MRVVDEVSRGCDVLGPMENPHPELRVHWLRGGSCAVSVAGMWKRKFVAPIRSAQTLLLGLCLAVAGGCDKPEPAAAAPGGQGAVPAVPGAQADTVAFQYKAGTQSLKQNAKVTFVVSGGQSGEMAADFTALLGMSDAGGSIKVNYSVAELRDLKLTGALQPKPKGDEPADPSAKFKALTGASIVSVSGKVDKDKTKALPENAKHAPGMRQFVECFRLPELPEQPLAMGVPVTVEEEEEIDFMGGMKMPTESESIFTLVSVDDSTGKRLATIKVEGETSGALEHPQAGMISLESSEEHTLIFNLDDQVPVSITAEATQSMTFGSQGGAEFSYSLNGTYEPG